MKFYFEFSFVEIILAAMQRGGIFFSPDRTFKNEIWLKKETDSERMHYIFFPACRKKNIILIRQAWYISNMIEGVETCVSKHNTLDIIVVFANLYFFGWLWKI